MIFYFSGTGNSLYAAANIAEKQQDTLVSISKEMEKKEPYRINCTDGELLGFVYPVYAWAPPEMVMDFIRCLEISGGTPYVFSVSTCGGDEGNTTAVLKKALRKKGLELDSAFSLLMPNNYVIGFDVDSKDEEATKLQAADKKLEEINAVIQTRQKGVYSLIFQGGAWIKSSLVNSMFNRFAMNTKKFYATDACTACGQCEKVCPVHTIAVDKKPAWGKRCTQCLACINVCPVHAIQYGKSTVNRGRYLHPAYHRLPAP